MNDRRERVCVREKKRECKCVRKTVRGREPLLHEGRVNL